MRICVFAVFLSLATARPEAGGGYRYSQPLLPISGNIGHGISNGPCCQQTNLLKGSGGYISGHGSSGFGQGLSAVVSSSYSASALGGGGGGYVNGHGPALVATPTPLVFTGPAQGIGYSHGSSGGYSGFSGHGSGAGGSYVHGGGFGGSIGSGGSFGQSGHGFGGQGGNFIGGGNLAGGGFSGGGFSGGGFSSGGVETSASIGAASIPDNSGSTLIQKHIYVHVPPPDPEDHIHATRVNQYVQPRKHYKIIFIKAPSVQAPSAVQIAAANALTEEKTLVYVLVKKPDEPSVEQLQNIQSTVHHHKPEVYFIKYKAKTQPQLQGLGLGGNFIGDGGASNFIGGGSVGSGFAHGGGSVDSGFAHGGATGFGSGSGVALTSNIGAEHNIAIATPGPTPYAPAGHPLIEPRVPEKIVPADSYGPPPEAV